MKKAKIASTALAIVFGAAIGKVIIDKIENRKTVSMGIVKTDITPDGKPVVIVGYTKPGTKILGNIGNAFDCQQIYEAQIKGLTQVSFGDRWYNLNPESVNNTLKAAQELCNKGLKPDPNPAPGSNGLGIS